MIFISQEQLDDDFGIFKDELDKEIEKTLSTIIRGSDSPPEI